MLIGSGIVRIDDGGRIKIPSEFAKSIIENYGTELYITSIQGHNALIYPLGEWRKTLGRVSAAPSMDPGIRKFVYVTGYYGKQSALDSKERILIHPLLRERARLNGELILIGNINSLVLWNREEFEKEYIDVPFTDDELRGLSEKGI